MKNIVIFASGQGSNAQKILDHFRASELARVRLIVSDRPDAGVLEIARREGIRTRILDSGFFREPGAFVRELEALPADLIVLAGFLRKIPPEMVQDFGSRIINLHPALLPKYGGKGMYGRRVHEAVLAAGEKRSGITIHYVNEHYDEGAPILQRSCEVVPGESPESLAAKIHALEHRWLPLVVEALIRKVPVSMLTD